MFLGQPPTSCCALGCNTCKNSIVASYNFVTQVVTILDSCDQSSCQSITCMALKTTFKNLYILQKNIQIFLRYTRRIKNISSKSYINNCSYTPNYFSSGKVVPPSSCVFRINEETLNFQLVAGEGIEPPTFRL